MARIEGQFEKISKYANDDKVIIPYRKTEGSAGYDFFAAEDIVIPTCTDAYDSLFRLIRTNHGSIPTMSLDEFASITKSTGHRPTLVPTGVKCKMPKNYYLNLSLRSSCALKDWLMLSNGQGIIDSDYYNNPDNEGHIFFQITNLSPVPIIIHKGDCFGQGIFMEYNQLNTEADNFKERKGGFGSTSK